MWKVCSWTAVLAIAALAWGATPAKKAPVKSAAVKKKTSKSSAKAKTSWRNRQLVPSPERYREIQEALAAKGFLKPEDATGTWNQISVDALKRFQTEQRIESSGKINSISLIALGLGPKREVVPTGSR